MQHEGLLELLAQTLDVLRVLLGSQGRGDQRLGFPAREQRRAMRARQQAHLAGDLPDVLGGPPVDASAGVQHQLAQVLLLGRLEDLFDLGLALGKFSLGRFHDLDPRRIQGRIALQLLADGHGGFDLGLGQLPHPRVQRRIHHRRLEGALGLAHRGPQFLLQIDERLRRLVREHERVDQHLLGHMLGPALHHHDGVAAGGHGQVQFRGLALGKGRIDDELAADASHAHAGKRAGPGQIGKVKRGRGAGHGQHVGRVLAVGRQHHGDDLGVEAPSLGKQRPAGSVDDPRGQHLGFGQPSFALEIAARDLARGRRLLQIVDGERHEIDARPHRGGSHRRDQHHGVAVANHHGPVGLLGHAADLDAELLAT